MISNFIETGKELLLNPTDALIKLRDEKLDQAFIFFLLIIAVFTVLSTIVTAIMTPAENPVFFFGGYALGAFIGSIVLVLICTGILHIFAFILGGINSIDQTLKAVIYSFVPVALLGWIPLVGLISFIWAAILLIFALRELQKMSTMHAALTVILPIIVLIVFIIAAFFAFVSVVDTAYAPII